MASNLFDMLSTLASDSQKLSDFWDDPEDEMDTTYNLSQEQIDLIMEAINDGTGHDFLKVVGDEVYDQLSTGKPAGLIPC